MDEDSYALASPNSTNNNTALHAASPERVNQQRSSVLLESPTRLSHHAHSHSRDSSVFDKISAFNSLAFQGKTLERKTNDAALKRAMLGREEAESEMRRYRDEKRVLQREVEEGRERERKVAERLEAYMVSYLGHIQPTGVAGDYAGDCSGTENETNQMLQEKYGRAKENWTHKSAQLDKEVRRIRKEAYHTQSRNVELQEELKSTRSAFQSAQSDLATEKERSMQREQEAFAARYQLVGVQEELAQMQEQIKLVEQERDALRTVAKNEEVARIAAEGRLPLPSSKEDDEFASPKKSRMSLDMITRSAASEEELEGILMMLDWEKQNAKRAHDQVEFLELECKLNCCAARSSHSAPQHQEGPDAKKVKIESEPLITSPPTTFDPSTGIFRTASPVEAPSAPASPAREESPKPSTPTKEATTPNKSSTPESHHVRNSIHYARTPSCEPPTAALVPDINTSLLSLLDEEPASTPASPSASDVDPSSPTPKTQTFHTISTTTRIPLADCSDATPRKPHSFLTTKSDVNDKENEPLAPTMTREQALAQIAERRGRARSLAQGTLTPRKQMVEGSVRRDISAPAIRSGNVRGRSQARC